jgi:hypothetical protein
MFRLQILILGLIGLAVVLLGRYWAPFIPAALAIALLGAATAGFVLQPDRDSWIVWVDDYHLLEGEGENVDLVVTKDAMKLRPSLCRLWVLFLPTMLGVGVLMGMYATGAWKTDLLGWGSLFPYGIMLNSFGVVIWIAISSWVAERWLLKRAEAVYCSGMADSGAYHFTVNGEYYGGYARLRLAASEPMVWNIVMFRRNRPSVNRLVRSFIFHRFDIIGRGIEDLENARLMGQQVAAKNLAQENS